MAFLPRGRACRRTFDAKAIAAMTPPGFSSEQDRSQHGVWLASLDDHGRDRLAIAARTPQSERASPSQRCKACQSPRATARSGDDHRATMVRAAARSVCRVGG